MDGMVYGWREHCENFIYDTIWGWCFDEWIQCLFFPCWFSALITLVSSVKGISLFPGIRWGGAIVIRYLPVFKLAVLRELV